MYSVSITAPSGGGKGTVISRMFEKFPDRFLLSRSATTRPIEEGEYYDHISSKKKFEELIMNNYFFEWEEINGDFYGTPKDQLEQAAKENKILIFDVDVKGATRLKQMLQNNMFVFIDSGDDPAIYEQRIRTRARPVDTEDRIHKRIARVPRELPVGRLECHVSIPNYGTKDDLIKKVDQILIPKVLGVIPGVV